MANFSQLIAAGNFLATKLTPAVNALTATGAGTVFTPFPGRDFNITVSGTFVGTVRLERSFDGTNWFPLTTAGVAAKTFTAPASEYYKESENAVQYRMNVTAFTSGTINTRLSQ